MSNRKLTSSQIDALLKQEEIHPGTSNIDLLGSQLIGEALKSSHIVTSLNLSNSIIKDSGIKAIANALKFNYSVTSLSLAQTEIGLKGIRYLSKALDANQTITQLDLSNNHLGDDGSEIVANTLKINESIANLKLRDCSIASRGAQALGKSLRVNKSLTRLNLSRNYFGDGINSIAVALQHNPSITSLILSDIELGPKGAKSIADALMKNKVITYLDLAGNNIGDEGSKMIAETLKGNQSIITLCLYNNQMGALGLQFIEDAMKSNTVINTIVNDEIEGNKIDKRTYDSVEWHLRCNKVCAELGLGIKYRGRVPKELTTEEDMSNFIRHYKENKQQRREDSIKKSIARDLVQKAFSLIDQEKLIEAKCFLEVAIYLEPSNYTSRIWEDVQTSISEREKLSEHELQMRVEKRISEIKEDIVHAEQQLQQTRSLEERDMIDQQLEVLHTMQARLQEQIKAYEEHQHQLQAREAQMQQREQLLNEQTVQLEQLLAELVTSSSSPDASALQAQLSAIKAGDKDISAARMRFESLQKAAKGAQQALVAEERRQRERVEWLQKQMELYKLKGMSPEQKTFRNFLKDVKRLSSVRHYMERTPHPLRCFISYAWETDTNANKALQKRLHKLKEDLEIAGMEVMLDICDMTYNMKNFMVDNINKAHKLLLICTPRLQERAAESTQNNLQLELQTALEKEKTTPNFITPLLFSGSFSTSLPPQVSHLLSLSFLSNVDYYSTLSSLAPLGLIPMLMGGERNKDYARILERMEAELQEYEKAKL